MRASVACGLPWKQLNRDETSLLNTVDQALDVIEAIDSPALGLASTRST